MTRPGRFCASRSVLALVDLSDMKLVQAQESEDIQSARELFREYKAWLGIGLCFQNFEAEVANLPGDYRPPTGRLLLATKDEEIAGCIALRKLSDDSCEMKRLFLRPKFRGQGLGRTLVERIVDEARSIGYRRMRLDTLPGRMDTAIALYRSLGFREIPPYYNNPVQGATFMELVL
jgi:putative acetyltransferase